MAGFFIAADELPTSFPHIKFGIMAHSTSGANFVKFFFYERNGFTRAVKTSLVALAYATARDLQIAPSAVLIRLVNVKY